MSKALLAGGRDTAIASGTKYLFLGIAQNLPQSTEANAQVPFRNSGTIDKLYLFVQSNASSATTTINTRKGGVSQNITVSISASATGQFSDSSNSDTITSGDLWNYMVSGHNGNVIIPIISVEFAVTGKSVGRGATYISAATYTSATNFMGLVGVLEPYLAFTATEANWQWVAKYTGTLANLFANVATNAATDANTVRSRKNGANGGMSASITASTTGIFEDTTHTDSFTSGDTLDYSYTRGTSAGSTTMYLGCSVEDATTGKTLLMAGGDEFGTGATTSYLLVGTDDDATEANVQNKMQFAAKASNLQVHIRTNNGHTGTWTSRKNSGAGAMSISISSGATGSFVDDTNSDTLAINDTYNNKFVMNAGSNIWDHDFTAVVIQDNTPTTSILKVSGVAQASISKISSVALASIKKVSGVANS